MVKLKMRNGEVFELSIYMDSVMRLESTHTEATDAYWDALGKDATTTREIVWNGAHVLYLAYLCTQERAGKLDSALTYEGFLEILPENVNEFVTAAHDLITPKAEGDSESHSRKARRS